MKKNQAANRKDQKANTSAPAVEANVVEPSAEGLLSEDKREKRRDRVTLGLCFILPLVMMLILHICLQVWPFGKNSVLVLDLNAQYISFFEKFREILVGGDSILYAFERNLGGEFMGIFAYYLSSPFSLLVALFPKNMITEAIFLIFILKTGFCGLTFGYFLNKMRKLTPAMTIAFASMYALCAYAVVMQHNLMWIDNLIGLPLLVVGMEGLIKEGRYRLFVLSLAYCVMSNFYIGYMTCIFVFIYFFARYFMLTPKERNPEKEKNHFFRTLMRIGFFSAIALAISMVIILPAYYSLSFGKFDFSNPKYEAKLLFDFVELLTKAFFGSYDTVRPEGLPFIYCGMLMPVLMPLYFFNKHFSLRKKIGFGALLTIFIVSFNFSLADIFWHGMQRPNWLNARFAFMFVFLTIWLAAESFAHLKELGAIKATISAVAWGAILVVLQTKDYENLPVLYAVWASLLFLVLYAVIVPFAKGKFGKVFKVVLSVVICIEMTLNGVFMLVKLDEDVVISTRDSYRSVIDKYQDAVDLIDDDTFYRADALVHRKKNDNFALGLNGLTSSTSTLNARTIDFIGKFGIAAKSHWNMYMGSTPVSDALFGIKYVIVEKNSKRPTMEFISRLYELIGTTDKNISVYENPYALSIAYAVDEGILDYDKAPVQDPNDPTKVIDEEYVEPFVYMNDVLSKMLGRDVAVFTKVEADGPEIEGITIKQVVGHTGYAVDNSSTASLTYTLTIESEKPVYFYLPSEYPRKVNVKLNGKSLGEYMKDETHSILELGSFNVGDKLEFVISPKDTNLYISKNTHYFWYYDEEVFLEAIEELAEGNMSANSETDDEIYGTITVDSEHDVVFTTIPYDSGWKAYVDGKQVDTKAVLNGSVIAFDCPEGTHDIRLVYRPWAVTLGLTVSILGLALFGFVVYVDYAPEKMKKFLNVKKNSAK